MPRIRRPNKRTKRALAVRRRLAQANQKNEETSEEIFERLLNESRSSCTSNDFSLVQSEHEENTSMAVSSDGSDSDYEPLVIEPMDIEEEVNIMGRRIVNINHVLKQLQEMAGHGQKCTMGKYKFQSEIVSGFYSKWIYHCENCEKEYVITSEPDNFKEEANDAFVWAAVSIGIGYSQAQEMFNIMDIPVMGANKFRSHERKIGKKILLLGFRENSFWEETLLNKMKENAEEEKRIAIEKGNYLNGVPYITVIGDGGWAKRSYGHGMNSASGVGVIIGAQTKKILFLGVRNKFCFVCTKSKNKDVESPEHECFINYKGSSTSMESDVIVEGFKRSEKEYGIVYKNYIGDGDSSVFTRIQEKCNYGRFVRKIECANHMTRCLNDKLHKLAENTSFPIESRKLLTSTQEGGSISRLERLVKGVRTAIKQAGHDKSQEDVQMLRNDLRNAVDHVFGNHSKCREFCQRKDKEESLLLKLDPTFLMKIRGQLQHFEKQAETLVFNETTNVAERFMGIVAKFTGGKRVNFASGGSFRRRCYGAAISHTKGPSWHLSPWKVFQKRSPGKVFKTRLRAREKNRVRRALLLAQKTKPLGKRRKREAAGYDADYGPLTVEPDIPEVEMESRCEEFLIKLKITDEEAGEIENCTRGQHKNSQWFEHRMNRLTASRFGAVVKRLPHTSCHNLVKSILYQKPIKSDAIAFGHQFEDIAIEKYEELKYNDQNIVKCGLFIDKEHPYLGASPDGLINTDGIVEVKCLYSVHQESLEEAVKNKKSMCVEIDDKGKLKLKKSHDYYYQIQGQLNILQRDWCDFIIYTRKDEMHVERIERDEELWSTKMLPKLTQFYKLCLLPEIVDSRTNRGLRIRDPPYILQAQENRQKVNVKKAEKTSKSSTSKNVPN